MVDSDLIEAIHSRITTSEEEAKEIAGLKLDLAYISITPKAFYPELTTADCFYKLREYLEAYLEQGYSIEEIIEGIKINLYKIDMMK